MKPDYELMKKVFTAIMSAKPKPPMGYVETVSAIDEMVSNVFVAHYKEGTPPDAV